MSDQNNNVNNSLTNLAGALATNQLNSTETIQKNLRYGLISNDRMTLSELYVEHGIVQTLIDQPVEDGFSKGFTAKTSQLDEDELKSLEAHIEKIGGYESIINSLKWARLFGGGAIIIIDDGKLSDPIKMSTFTKNANIKYYASDCWELTKPNFGDNAKNIVDDEKPYYLFYGQKVDPSRVIEVQGKKAPSIKRTQLRGWGMSEVERLVRSVNQYIKNNNVIFELLDEAKVDVYKIKQFNQAMLTAGGTSGVEKRVQLSNEIKSYLDALVMDTEDDYQQKQMSFSGLGEMLSQIRMGVASDMKMPITKIFGVSSAGFNSGEDDIENYNSMVESSVRKPSLPLINEIYSLEAYRLYGVEIDDFDFEFPSLRVLNAEQEENVKNQKFNRLQSSFDMGLIDVTTFKESINKANLLPVNLDVNEDTYENINTLNLKGSNNEL